MQMLAIQLPEFLSGENLLSGMTWIAVITLLVAGFLGTFIPVMPGTTLILCGTLLHYFARGMGESDLSWQGVILISILYVLSIVLDWLGGALGAKWFGSSKWGIIGAIAGGVVGIFFHIPGMIIGPIAGVFLFEMLFAEKQIKEASSSTVGTVVGGLAGMVARVILGLAMVAWFIADVFIVN